MRYHFDDLPHHHFVQHKSVFSIFTSFQKKYLFQNQGKYSICSALAIVESTLLQWKRQFYLVQNILIEGSSEKINKTLF
jgi:hypothetical protein